MMEVLKYLEGDRVYLRSLIESDYGETMVKWVNDKEVTRYLARGSRPGSLIELQAEFKSYSFNPADVVMAICDAKTNEYIGVVGLYTINPMARHAEFRILIGSKSHWGKGYGAEATELIVGYGFRILNLEKIWLGVNSENQKAHKSYADRGFITEGTLRNELYRNGKYFDIVRMSLLRKEFEESLLKWKSSSFITKQLSAH